MQKAAQGVSPEVCRWVLILCTLPAGAASDDGTQQALWPGRHHGRFQCAVQLNAPIGKVEQGLPTSPSPPKWAGVFFLVLLLSWTSSRPELQQYDTVIGLRVWSKPCIMLCRMLHCLRTSHNRCFEQTSGPALCWKDHVVSYGRLKAQTSAPASPCPYRVLPCQLVPVIAHSNVCVKLESYWKASLCMLHCT